MYALMLGSFIFFAIFGVRIQLKEEIVKLLPDSALNNELAFTEVAIKDKVFIQLLSAEGADSLSTKQLGEYMDKYISQLSEADSSSHLIKEILYKLDADMALGAMDYAFNHVPSFVDTSLYKSIDKAMTDSNVLVEIKGNDIVYTFDLSKMDGYTEELAKSDAISKALEDALTSAASTFGGISKSIEETTEIEGVNTIVSYNWGDEVIVTRTFTSADASSDE